MRRIPPHRPSRACLGLSRTRSRSGPAPVVPDPVPDRHRVGCVTDRNLNETGQKSNPNRIGKLGDRALHVHEIINPKPL
jgi:hypothetical protein